jgi:uncharacterized protein
MRPVPGRADLARGDHFPVWRPEMLEIAELPAPVEGKDALARHTLLTFADAPDAHTLERLARAATVAMGGGALLVSTVMTGAEVRRLTVPHTLSFARRLGAVVRSARQGHRDPIAAVCETTGGAHLFRGKIVDVQRRLVAGFARGDLLIEGAGDWRGRRLRIAIQNEYLIAWEEDRVAATAPDLICLVDETTAE